MAGWGLDATSEETDVSGGSTLTRQNLREERGSGWPGSCRSTSGCEKDMSTQLSALDVLPSSSFFITNGPSVYLPSDSRSSVCKMGADYF